MTRKPRIPDAARRLEAARDANKELQAQLADARRLIAALAGGSDLYELGAWLRELAELAYPLTGRTYDGSTSRSAELPLPGESTHRYRREQDRLTRNILNLVRASRDRALQVATKTATVNARLPKDSESA